MAIRRGISISFSIAKIAKHFNAKKSKKTKRSKIFISWCRSLDGYPIKIASKIRLLESKPILQRTRSGKIPSCLAPPPPCFRNREIRRGWVKEHFPDRAGRRTVPLRAEILLALSVSWGGTPQSFPKNRKMLEFESCGIIFPINLPVLLQFKRLVGSLPRSQLPAPTGCVEVNLKASDRCDCVLQPGSFSQPLSN